MSIDVHAVKVKLPKAMQLDEVESVRYICQLWFGSFYYADVLYGSQMHFRFTQMKSM